MSSMFPENAPSAELVFFRTYSHNENGKRETWKQVAERTVAGIKKLGKLTDEETKLIIEQHYSFQCLASGRSLWTSGRPWIEEQVNFPGAYNCTSLQVNNLDTFGLLMDLAMMGCGTGAVLSQDCIQHLPSVRNRLDVEIVAEIGSKQPHLREEKTRTTQNRDSAVIWVGDSRKGWATAYQKLIDLAFDTSFPSKRVKVYVDLSSVRPAGEKLKGFGGVSNPVKLPDLFYRSAEILNGAIDRQLDSIECCLLIDEAAIVVVAGNIRRTAGIRQFSQDDLKALVAKDNLWYQDKEGNWKIDPKRDALRMSNHTRIFKSAPTLEECTAAVKKQHKSGEGAIQWAGEALARGNGDLWNELSRTEFLETCKKGEQEAWFKKNLPNLSEGELNHRLNRLGLNPCVTADTWVHTEFGARQVKDLIGKQHGTYVNGELFSTTPEGFFCTGDRPVLALTTKEGYSLKLTGSHQILKVTTQTQKSQYTEWVAAEDLKPGDRICLHNHRGIESWNGIGNSDEGWLLGQLVGNGSLAKTEWNDQAILRFWGDSKEEMIEYAVSTLKRNVVCGTNLAGYYHQQHDLQQVSSAGLAKLAAQFGIIHKNKTLTHEVEKASYDFYRGFLRGLFDSDGCVQGTLEKGISVRLSQSNLELLYGVQRMLARLGIKSTVYQNRRDAGYRLMPDSYRNPASYWCKASHELVIANDNLITYRDVIGFRKPDKCQKLEDLLCGYKRKLNRERFIATVESISSCGSEPVYDCTVPGSARFDANGIVAHNCGEILGADFMCNLSEIHLNRIDAQNLEEQIDAFKAGALIVSAFLQHEFDHPKLQKSRELDPIVGVSFTGLFDFFVQGFGVDWLRWWQAGRPEFFNVPSVKPNIEAICAQFNVELDNYEIREAQLYVDGWNYGKLYRDLERIFLESWREIVETTVQEYCEKHELKCPNRCTTTQPAGTKSLLTGASPGWHPPKGSTFIRRITVGKNHPIALAAIDYGYSVVPAQSDKDENGQLLDDPFDERCTEWLIEVPTQTVWAMWPGVQDIDISKFSAAAQFDFYMQVQKFYTRHNTSATIEVREHETEELGKRIYEAIQNNEGYVSAAILARFDEYETFPRMPFQPIARETYDRLCAEVEARRTCSDFYEAISRYTSPDEADGPAACDSDKCLMPIANEHGL